MILLLGGTGYVGMAFQRLLAKRGINYANVARSETDYTYPPVLLSLLQKVKPEFVICAAGYTGKPNVDASESQKLTCLQANAVLPGVVGETCRELGIPWGHVSSGCIYTGSRPDGSGFREDDLPNFSFRQNNSSFYSGTKALGEEVLRDMPECFIWRLRIPFNEVNEPRNYLYKLMQYERLLEVRNSISQLDEFVTACFECWERRVPFGTYNVTNPGSVLTSEVADMIRKSGRCRRDFKFFTDEAEFMQKKALAPRASCVMDSSKLLATGIRLTDVNEALERALRDWKNPPGAGAT